MELLDIPEGQEGSYEAMVARLSNGKPGQVRVSGKRPPRIRNTSKGLPLLEFEGEVLVSLPAQLVGAVNGDVLGALVEYLEGKGITWCDPRWLVQIRGESL